MSKPAQTAAYCGLFCESCTLYIATTEEPDRLEKLSARYGKDTEEVRCEGCRSETLSFYCATCKIKACARKKDIDFCSECADYPCAMLSDFQKLAPHRIELFESLDYYKEHGYKSWCEKMRNSYACEECGAINTVYDAACRKCGHVPPNPYVERNADAIVEALSQKIF